MQTKLLGYRNACCVCCLQRSHEKGSLFNLDEDIELTHYGQSLAEMEKFEAPEISDDDDLDPGNLDGKPKPT